MRYTISLSLSIYIYIYIYIYISVCLSVCVSIFLSISVTLYMFIRVCSHTHPLPTPGKRHPSRSASNDSLLDAAEGEMTQDPRLPNKDFRKSELNRSRYYDPESDVFEREPSPEVRRPRGHRRNDSYGKDPQVFLLSLALTSDVFPRRLIKYCTRVM